MATLTHDEIASVSLKDADTNPDSFAQLKSAVSASELMPITTTFFPLLKSVAY